MATLQLGLVGWSAVTEAVEAAALHFIKRSTTERSGSGGGSLLIGSALYALTGVVLSRGVREAGVGVANGMWNAMSNVTGAAVGIYNGETYRATQWLGLLFGVLSAVLLAL